MKKVVLILLSSLLIITAGTAYAYYNTSSLGYDNANIFYKDKNSIQIFYINIDTRNIKKKINYIIELMPDRFITI